MSYERLSAREKQVADMLLNPTYSERNFREQIAQELGISLHTVKNILRIIAFKYGIDNRLFHPSTRIVYLRAKELGLI